LISPSTPFIPLDPSKSMSKKIYIIIALIVLLAAAVAIFFLSNAEEKASDTGAVPVVDLAEVRQEQADQAREEFASGKKQTFTHTALGFSFEYPEGYTVGNFAEGEDAEVVLLQKDNVGFQLFISPFDENIALTPQRIKQDISDIEMQNEIVISVGGSQGVVFSSEDDGEKSTEIWFVNANRLYQITTYPEFDLIMVDILETWRWN